MIQDDPDLNGTYGVKRECALHAIKHYHVINWLPSYITHDLFEGVAVDVLEKYHKLLCGAEIL